MSNDPLIALQDWYAAECNGDWEHSYGIKISTLDNPGWLVSIDLADTALQSKAFETVEDQYAHETDWMRCQRVDLKFEGVCGANRLIDIVQVFLDWAVQPDTPSP